MRCIRQWNFGMDHNSEWTNTMICREAARLSQLQLRVAHLNAEEQRRRLQVTFDDKCNRDYQRCPAALLKGNSMLQAQAAGEEPETAEGPSLDRFVGQLTGKVSSVTKRATYLTMHLDIQPHTKQSEVIWNQKAFCRDMQQMRAALPKEAAAKGQGQASKIVNMSQKHGDRVDSGLDSDRQGVHAHHHS